MLILPVCIVFTFISLSTTVNSANILAILPFPPPSHHIWNSKLVDALAERGHNLTVLSVVKPAQAPKNVHYIHLEQIYSTMMKELNFAYSDAVMKNHYSLIKMLYNFVYVTCKGSFASKGFQTLKNYPADFKFDLVLYDLNAGSCLLGFLQKFQYPPLVGISAFKYSSEFARVTGSHMYPSYIPGSSMAFGTDMNFWQRLENFYFTVIDYLYRNYVHQPSYERLIAPNFPANLPPLEELEKNMTIALLSIHPATDYPIPFGPNVINVGGLAVDKPKPLSEDLEQFISSGKDGAIFVSFGTLVDSEMVTDEKQRMVIEAVKKFPNYNFLWKFEKDLSAGKISNLLIRPWFPQNDILAHPKVKLFVSHAGGLSNHEATWHGVPMVTVPFFLDQISNSKQSVLAAVAKEVDLVRMTTEHLEDAIRTVLEDPSFKQRMKIRSTRFRDRPSPPRETAVWWIEYILRDPNPAHLRSPALNLGWFRANCFDIILFNVSIVCLILTTCWWLLKQIYKRIVKSGEPKKKDKMK